MFWVGSGAELAAGVKAAGSTGSSTVASSETTSSSAPAREASSGTEKWAPQELNTATTDTTKAIKKIPLKKDAPRKISAYQASV